MKKVIFTLLLATMFTGLSIQAQNVGIGEADPQQKLHINDDTITTIQTIRVEDLADGKEGRLAAPATKTAAAGYRGLVVDGLGDILSMEFDWTIFGNADTNAGGYAGTCPNFTLPGFSNDGTAIPDDVNYAGTSDLTDWVIGSGGHERGRLLRDGQMVFYPKSAKVPSTSPTGCVPAYPTLDAFSVYSDGPTYAINAYSEQGPALYASAERRALEATGTMGDGAFLTGSENGTQSYGDGILTFLNPIRGAGMSLFQGLLGSAKYVGVRGSAWGAPGTDAWGGEFSVGDGFSPTNSNLLAAVAIAANAGGTQYKILDLFGGGLVVSTSRAGVDGENKILYAPEGPSPMYEDYGHAKLVDGKIVVNIDADFAHMVHVDEDKPLKIFVQLEGDCNGVFITNKTASSFEVKELAGGKSNVAFTYKVIAHAKDVVRPNGTVNHLQDIRFPQLDTKRDGPQSAKAVSKTDRLK